MTVITPVIDGGRWLPSLSYPPYSDYLIIQTNA
jgi:hypothetical protein